MLESLSPYQLLKACSIKAPHPTFHNTSEDACNAAPVLDPSTIPVTHPSHTASQPSTHIPAQLRRTHYIADIHSRHTAAQRYLPG